MKPPIRKIAIALSWLFAAAFSHASEMVYSPINPSFGGSPLYGNTLLNSALATNKHKEKEDGLNSGSLFGTKSPLEQFNDTLERSILSQLASSATSQILQNGQLVPGSVETGNFRIDVVDIGGMLTVTTTDKVTGASTSFQVGQ